MKQDNRKTNISRMMTIDKVLQARKVGLINSTSNDNCPACNEWRIHTEEENKEFHPNVGTGVSLDRKLAGG